jgi:hydrogenase nickel incorporation protein HypA/HybF
MHEFSIAQNLVRRLEQVLPSKTDQEVRAVTLRLGELAGISPQSLALGFEMASRGTPLHGAMLIIEPVAAVYRCGGCGAEFPSKRGYIPCPTCRSFDVELLSGDELYVAEMETSATQAPISNEGRSQNSSQREREGEATLTCGGPCGAAAPPMPPHPALAPAKPDARFGFAGGERGSGLARPSQGSGGIGAFPEGEAHRPPDPMAATQAPTIGVPR